MRILSFLLDFLLLLTICVCVEAHAQNLDDCNIQSRCPDEKELVWATDEEVCHIFQNRCFFRAEQCSRHQSGRVQLIESEREICKQTCHRICEDIYEPICVQFFEEAYMSFSNECELHNFICENERPHSAYSIGECPELIAARIGKIEETEI